MYAEKYTIKPRAKVEEIVFEAQFSNDRFKLNVINVSLDGMGIVSSKALEVSDVCNVAIKQRDLKFEVVWRQPKFGKHDVYRYGLKLVGSSPESLVEMVQNDQEFGSTETDYVEKIIRDYGVVLEVKGGTTIYNSKINPDAFFILLSGKVEILSNSQPQFFLGTMVEGSCFGKIAPNLAEDEITFQAITKCEMIRLDKSSIQKIEAAHPDVYNHLTLKKIREISFRLKNLHSLAVDSMKHEMTHLNDKLWLQKFIIACIICLSIYMIVQRYAIENLRIATSSIISVPMVLSIVTGTIYLIRTSKFPIRFFGLKKNFNFKKDLFETLISTGIFLLLLTSLKWMMIQFGLGQLSGDLIEFSGGKQNFATFDLILLMIIYAGIVPFQEIIRCTLQSSIEKLFSGPRRRVWGILLTALLMGSVHVHISAIAAVLIIVPNIYWGWLYLRHQSIVTLTISHIIIGEYALFLLGFSKYF